MCDSKLSGLHTFESTTISLVKKPKNRLWVHETLISEVIFTTLTENSSAITIDSLGPSKYSSYPKWLQGHISMHSIALKLSEHFYLLMEKTLGCYFQDNLLTIRKYRATRKHHGDVWKLNVLHLHGRFKNCLWILVSRMAWYISYFKWKKEKNMNKIFST